MFFLAGLIVLEACADYFAGLFETNTSKIIFAVTALLFYIVANISWLYSVKHGVGLGRGAVLFGVIQTLLGIVIGILFFKESYTNVQYVGMVLGVVAMVLVIK